MFILALGILRVSSIFLIKYLYKEKSEEQMTTLGGQPPLSTLLPTFVSSYTPHFIWLISLFWSDNNNPLIPCMFLLHPHLLYSFLPPVFPFFVSSLLLVQQNCCLFLHIRNQYQDKLCFDKALSSLHIFFSDLFESDSHRTAPVFLFLFQLWLNLICTMFLPQLPIYLFK